jgi:nitrite reductase (NADH) small subunit
MLIAPPRSDRRSQAKNVRDGVSSVSDFVRICSQSECPAIGQVREVDAAGHTLCLANVNGTIAVLDGTCPHEGGPLGEGSIENGRVVCPWHAFAFDVRSGAAEDDPDLKAKVFEARLESGDLYARL